MAKPLPQEDLVITAQLRSRPVPPSDPALGLRLLQGSIGQMHKGPHGFLQAVVDSAVVAGGGAERCSAGIYLKERGADGLDRMRAAAHSGPGASFLGDELPLSEFPSDLLQAHTEVVLLHEPQRHFDRRDRGEGHIPEMLVMPFGKGSTPVGMLWVAARDPHRFHQGHADLLKLVAEQGALIYKSIQEREHLAQLAQQGGRSALLDQLPIGIA